MTPAALLALSDERDTWTARMLAAGRDGYRLGYDAGFRDGGEELFARRRAWPPIAVAGPSRDELELRRWGPGGREHFSDPRPGDFGGFGAHYTAPEHPPWPPSAGKPSDHYANGRQRHG